MVSPGGSNGPVIALHYLPGANVRDIKTRRRPRKSATSILKRLAGCGMPCTGFPIVRKSALWSYKALSDPFCRRWSPDLQSILIAYALIPAAQKEAGIVRVVIEVVMCEKKIINLRW